MAIQPAAAMHTLTLKTTTESTITNISLYTDHAQITRCYVANVLAGQLILTIPCLPNVIDHESVKVEGQGPVIIQGVVASKVEMQQPEKTSPLMEELHDKEDKVQGALGRCKKVINVIDNYMDKISIEHLDVSELGEAMEVYDATEEKWDSKVHDLERELELLNDQIATEIKRLEAMVPDKKLRTQVVVDLVATEDTELHINLIYAVSHASWEAKYDIRIDLQDGDTLVKVTYEAGITQRTGETWRNAPIYLETAQPTFGLDIPTLDPWNISHTRPAGHGLEEGIKRHRKLLPDEDDLDYIKVDTAYVTSKGHANATFRIPGSTTIPTDEEEHEVTIASLELPAKMTWASVPRLYPRVHLEANITNSSEYTFISGPSDVYVDQSFISRSSVPNVSPGEVFKCLLGVDPSIRVTYHPQTSMVGETGFYNKFVKHFYSQRITVHNTKPVDISGVKITDRIPVSQDANITVNVMKPALTIPTLPTIGQGQASKESIRPQPVKVSEGVVAQWHGADQPGCDVLALGRTGLFDWVCSVAAHGKIDLVLEYEMTTSQKTEIFGL